MHCLKKKKKDEEEEEERKNCIPILTTELIGVKVSCPLATVHGRPADCTQNEDDDNIIM